MRRVRATLPLGKPAPQNFRLTAPEFREAAPLRCAPSTLAREGRSISAAPKTHRAKIEKSLYLKLHALCTLVWGG
jgi:hypothetical protein